MANLENCMYEIINRRPDAFALVRGGERYPEISGRVSFYETTCGVAVAANINGLPSTNETGIFAFHIHEGTNCGGTEEMPFANTIGHYDVGNHEHPNHLGDMPPLFSDNGDAFLLFVTGRFMVQDIIGRTVVIHANPDDFVTQPAGNSGEKIACGVIQR